MDDIAISVTELSKYFAETVAVDRISFDVPRGEIFGFLGSNGAGKTTTIRLLLGLMEQTHGSINVLGYDPRSHGREIRKNTGILLEDDALYTRLSIYRNLQFHGEINRIGQPRLERRMETVLHDFGLWDRRGEPVHTLSRGFRRRVALARALLHEPRLLILDEPAAGLDPATISSIRDNLKYLSTSDVTVFMATHNLTEAERLCHRIGIIHNGRLLRSGRTKGLLFGMMDPAVRITCSPPGEDTRKTIFSVPGISECSVYPWGLYIVMDDSRITATVVRILVESGVSVESVVPLSGNLEDYYLRVVHGSDT